MSKSEDIPLSLLENPPAYVLEAMALERARQERANGHGKYGYRDIWLAGIAAIRKRGEG